MGCFFSKPAKKNNAGSWTGGALDRPSSSRYLEEQTPTRIRSKRPKKTASSGRRTEPLVSQPGRKSSEEQQKNNVRRDAESSTSKPIKFHNSGLTVYPKTNSDLNTVHSSNRQVFSSIKSTDDQAIPAATRLTTTVIEISNDKNGVQPNNEDDLLNRRLQNAKSDTVIDIDREPAGGNNHNESLPPMIKPALTPQQVNYKIKTSNTNKMKQPLKTNNQPSTSTQRHSLSNNFANTYVENTQSLSSNTEMNKVEDTSIHGARHFETRMNKQSHQNSAMPNSHSYSSAADSGVVTSLYPKPELSYDSHACRNTMSSHQYSSTFNSHSCPSAESSNDARTTSSNALQNHQYSTVGNTHLLHSKEASGTPELTKMIKFEDFTNSELIKLVDARKIGLQTKTYEGNAISKFKEKNSFGPISEKWHQETSYKIGDEANKLNKASYQYKEIHSTIESFGGKSMEAKEIKRQYSSTDNSHSYHTEPSVIEPVDATKPNSRKNGLHARIEEVIRKATRTEEIFSTRPFSAECPPEPSQQIIDANKSEEASYQNKENKSTYESLGGKGIPELASQITEEANNELNETNELDVGFMVFDTSDSDEAEKCKESMKIIHQNISMHKNNSYHSIQAASETPKRTKLIKLEDDTDASLIKLGDATTLKSRTQLLQAQIDETRNATSKSERNSTRPFSEERPPESFHQIIEDANNSTLLGKSIQDSICQITEEANNELTEAGCKKVFDKNDSDIGPMEIVHQKPKPVQDNRDYVPAFRDYNEIDEKDLIDDLTESKINSETYNQMIKILKRVFEQAKPFHEKIDQFTELENSNTHYYIEESLRRCIDKLDDMFDDIGDIKALRDERKKVYKFVFPMFERLDAKVQENKLRSNGQKEE